MIKLEYNVSRGFVDWVELYVRLSIFIHEKIELVLIPITHSLQFRTAAQQKRIRTRRITTAQTHRHPRTFRTQPPIPLHPLPRTTTLLARKTQRRTRKLSQPVDGTSHLQRRKWSWKRWRVRRKGLDSVEGNQNKGRTAFDGHQVR